MSHAATRRKSVTCKYLAYKFLQGDGTFEWVRLPLVHVYLKHTGDFSTDALVDSGSTATFLPNEFIDILGLTDLRESSAVGAGGSFPTWVAKLDTLQVLKGKTPFHAFRNVAVHIPRSEGAIPYVVLGRDTIFERFDITFYEHRQKLTFMRL